MTAYRSDIRARAQALVLATNDYEEQQGISALAAPLLAGSSNLVFDSAINRTAIALFEASESPGFRRGVTLLAQAIADSALPVEPRAKQITIQALQQQIDVLTAVVLSGARLPEAVLLLNQREEALP